MLRTVLWIVLIYNVLYLIGCSTIAKFLFKSNFIWLRALTKPHDTAKDINKAAGAVGRHVLWAIAAAVALFLTHA